MFRPILPKRKADPEVVAASPRTLAFEGQARAFREAAAEWLRRNEEEAYQDYMRHYFPQD